MTFGDFVREKRLKEGVNLRALAKELDIAPAYMSDIEKNHRYPPDKEKIYKIAEVLKLSEDEKNQMFEIKMINSDITSFYIPEINTSQITRKDCFVFDSYREKLTKPWIIDSIVY